MLSMPKSNLPANMNNCAVKKWSNIISVSKVLQLELPRAAVFTFDESKKKIVSPENNS